MNAYEKLLEEIEERKQAHVAALAEAQAALVERQNEFKALDREYQTSVRSGESDEVCLALQARRGLASDRASAAFLDIEALGLAQAEEIAAMEAGLTDAASEAVRALGATIRESIASARQARVTYLASLKAMFEAVEQAAVVRRSATADDRGASVEFPVSYLASEFEVSAGKDFNEPPTSVAF